jgi:hypothetical protein
VKKKVLICPLEMGYLKNAVKYKLMLVDTVSF